MTACRVITFVGLFSLTMVSESSAGDPVEEVLAATVRITYRDHSGTCFFLRDETDVDENPRKVILVTAAHVLDQMKDKDCELILRSGSLETGYQRLSTKIEIRDGGKPRWTRHPDVGVATLPVDLPENATVKPIAIQSLVTEAQLTDRTIRTGQEVWIACYPAKLEANEAGWPVLRRGSIATFPLIPMKTAKTILIDYDVFGGDSGAPIIVNRDGKLLIVGITASMHRQTDKATLPFEEKTVYMPLGLSIAVQAAYVRETIELMQRK